MTSSRQKRVRRRDLFRSKGADRAGCKASCLAASHLRFSFTSTTTMPLLHSNPGASVIGCVSRWVFDAQFGPCFRFTHLCTHHSVESPIRAEDLASLYLHPRSTSTHTTSDMPLLCPFDHRSTAVSTFDASRVSRDHCDGLASSLCQIQSISVLRPGAS